jgi:hypothetical protein
MLSRRPPSAGPGLQSVAFAPTAIAVIDLDRAIDWYRSILLFTSLARRELRSVSIPHDRDGPQPRRRLRSASLDRARRRASPDDRRRARRAHQRRRRGLRPIRLSGQRFRRSRPGITAVDSPLGPPTFIRVSFWICDDLRPTHSSAASDPLGRHFKRRRAQQRANGFGFWKSLNTGPKSRAVTSNRWRLGLTPLADTGGQANRSIQSPTVS